MNKCTETLLAAIMALGPTIIAVTMMHHYGPLGIACSLIFSGIYMLVLVLALTLRSCLRRRSPQSDQERLQRSEEEEDSPPSYEVVTAKPPPYSLLFASAPPTGDVTSCRMTAVGTAAPVHHLLPQDAHHHKGVLHCYTWIMTDSETSPPSYFEAIGENSLQASETTSPSSPIGGSAPTSPSPVGATPHSPPHSGTTASSPTFSFTAHISHAPGCTACTSPSSSDTKNFPT